MTSRSIGMLVLCPLLLTATVDLGEAQEPASTGAAQPADTIPAMTPTMDASAASDGLVQGLPQRAPQPRTLHDFWPAFAGLAVVWLLIVGYVLGFGGALRRITARMQSVEKREMPQ